MNLSALTRIGRPLAPSVTCPSDTKKSGQFIEDIVTTMGAAVSTAAVGAFAVMSAPNGAGVLHALGTICWGIASAGTGAAIGGLTGELINEAASKFSCPMSSDRQLITPKGTAALGALAGFGAVLIGGFTSASPASVALVGGGLIAGIGLGAAVIEAQRR